MTRLNPTQLRYLREVLGIEQILWGKRASFEAPVAKSGRRLYAFVSPLSTTEQELLTKMLQAMKLQPNDYRIFEDPTQWQPAMQNPPEVAVVFGLETAQSMGREFTRGKFVDVEGVPTIFTYSPKDLATQPELKAEAWKDLKIAMRRLT